MLLNRSAGLRATTTTQDIDYSPIIYALSMIVGGIAMSYASPKDIVRRTVPCLYFISIFCSLVFCYIYVMLSLFGTDPAIVRGFNTVADVADFITAWGLEACYILRLLACLRMYRHKNLVYLLFIFPAVYTLTDIISISNYFLKTPITVSQAQYGMFCFFLMIGDIISHITTVYILLTNASNLKEARQKRNLEIVAATAVLNQVCFLSFCCLSFYETTYSTALIYFSWILDHIIFSLVNRHIRLFLNSRGYSDSGSSHRVSEMESKASANNGTANGANNGAIVHERAVAMMEHV